jgi:hypothetical protein
MGKRVIAGCLLLFLAVSMQFIVGCGQSTGEGAKQPTPTPTPHTIFPVAGTQSDSFAEVGGHMQTSIRIERSGAVSGVTHISEDTLARGFKGAVQVVLFDAQHNMIWVSAKQRYGVDGKLFGTWERFENWSDQVPADKLDLAAEFAIAQRTDEDELWSVIEKGFAHAKEIYQDLKDLGIVQSVPKSS